VRTPKTQNWPRNSLAPILALAFVALTRTSALAGGGVDPTFQAAIAPTSTSLAVPTFFLLDKRQPAGGVYLFGSFNRIDGIVRYEIAHFDATGAFDPGFVAAREVSYSSSSLDRRSSIIAGYTAPDANAVQADGKLLVLAKLPVTTAGAKEAAGLLRLNLDGSLDPDFHGPIVDTSPTTTSHVITLPLANGQIVFFSDGILQRLNPDGSRDTSFAIAHITNGGGPSSPRIILQSDGSYLLHGGFDQVNGVTRLAIARVGNDGTLDATFDPGAKLRQYFERFIGAVLQPDGNILLFGDFPKYPGTNSSCLIRVLPNGDVDPTLKDVQVTRAVDKPEIDKVYLQPDGRILIVGGFTGVDGAARLGIARLNGDGSLDSNFDAGNRVNYGVPSLVLQPDGKLLLYGPFTSGQYDKRFIRLNTDGSHDGSFFAATGVGLASEPSQVALLPNLRLLVLGGFDSHGPRNGFGRLNSDGNLDQTYNPAGTLFSATNLGAQVLMPRSDGKLLLNGVYQIGLGYVRYSIERLNQNGTIDSGFDPGTGPFAGYGGYYGLASVRAMAIQSDGKIIVGGYFNSFNGVNRGGIVRLEANGSVDPTFNPGDTSQDFAPTTNAIAIAPNGQIYASGKFMAQANEDTLARINPDGTLDPTFQPARIGPSGVGPRPYSLAVQADGKPVFLFGLNGDFDKPAVARLNTNGSLDTTFAAAARTPGVIRLVSPASQVRMQADGKIVVAGSFVPNSDPAAADTAYIKHAYLERLNPDGSPDSSFNIGGSGPNNKVNDVFIEPNGAIVIGGIFTYVNGTTRRGVALLTPNGTVNDSVDPGDGPDASVNAVAAQADGKLLITGWFTSVSQVPKDGIARLLVPSGQLLNLSTRAQVLTGENVLITGFIVTGMVPTKIMIRGLGPSIPLSGQLNDPMLELFDGAGISIGKNDDWRSTQEQEIKDTKIPPANDRESAIVKTLAPGNYTTVLNGKSDGTGIGLVEVYDLSAAAAQLANISTRGSAGRDSDLMIAGVIVGQTPNGNTATVLVRALGPSLAAHGISGALTDPVLELHDPNGGLVADNDDWRIGAEQSITDTGIPPADDRESALVQVLTAGNYTAIMGGKDGLPGVGLIEIYNLQ
jgi:uncharacterized delta-60 repeat protein